HFTRDISADDRKRLSGSATAAIEKSVIPAYKRLKAFLEKEYLPACQEKVGCWQQPEGEAVYAAACRRHTTTELPPDEIHAIGLKEVERITAGMLKVKEETGFKGSLPE